MGPKHPVFSLTYAGRNITADLAPFVTSITYTDHMHGESDEIQIALQDADGRWRGAWLPQQGDQIALTLGYEGETALPCGDFEIDEVQFDGPPDKVQIRAVATYVSLALRTANSAGRENTTLAAIVQDIAQRHGLVLQGDIAHIPMQRSTQNEETDLAYLKRLAEDYGHVFEIRGSRLVFMRREALEQAPAALTLRRAELSQYGVTINLRTKFEEAGVDYHDPKKKELVTGEEVDERIKKADRKKITERTESPEQAAAKAKARLHEENKDAQKLRLTLPGQPYLVAGQIMALQDLGALSGRYIIETSTHRLARASGYTTEAEGYRVQ